MIVNHATMIKAEKPVYGVPLCLNCRNESIHTLKCLQKARGNSSTFISVFSYIYPCMRLLMVLKAHDLFILPAYYEFPNALTAHCIGCG